MMNEFRRHPKICGWLYTEHHDVINEWNGYYRYDRTEKFTGLDEIVPGMSLRDLHGPFYLSTGSDLCRDVKPGEEVTVPLWASFLTGQAPSPQLRLRVTAHRLGHVGPIPMVLSNRPEPSNSSPGFPKNLSRCASPCRTIGRWPC